ncbi:hypothetical protein JST97_28255 [bacterium]|nr:hypothetical protein [bacterium]
MNLTQSQRERTPIDAIARRTVEILEMSERLRQACRLMQQRLPLDESREQSERYRQLLRLKARMAGVVCEKRRITRIYQAYLDGQQQVLLDALAERIDLLQKQCERLRFACHEQDQPGGLLSQQLSGQVSEASERLKQLKERNQELEVANFAARELSARRSDMEAELELRCQAAGASLASLLQLNARLQEQKARAERIQASGELDRVLDTVLEEELEEELQDRREQLSSLERQLSEAEREDFLLEGSAFDEDFA